ncbi:MAG TPA: DUF1761 domain-containing protein [Candidatus Acidoferrales bacterium]|nr:DUF1761 domain-containing protein [Candidatus Acidoferrales bacterium]
MRINYMAVVVSAIVYWLLGELWYGVIFAKPWMALEHMTMADVQQMNLIAAFIIAFVADLILAYVLANVCLWRQVDSASKGASLGVLFWIGFVGTTSLTTYQFEGRPFHLFLINYGYCLVGMVITGAILGAWKKKAA